MLSSMRSWVLPVHAGLVGGVQPTREPGDPVRGNSLTVCDHLITDGHSRRVIAGVRSFVDIPPHPAAEWLVESA